MPLRDHFRPSSSDELPWSTVSAVWVVAFVKWLNQTLPKDEYRAFANVHLGRRAEADVAEFTTGVQSTGHQKNGAVATLPMAPPAIASIPAFFPVEAEVQIQERRATLTLSAVIEIVSPGNKKERDEREAFLAKCIAYLRQGVGLVIVDVVTNSSANFHNELMRAIGGATPLMLPSDQRTYVAAYRPVLRPKRTAIDMWPFAAEIGEPIPSVPLPIRGGPLLPMDIEKIYTDALADNGF